MNKDITIGEKYGKAMKITTHSEADDYFEECVEHTMGFGWTREEAEKIERENIGYYSGFYDTETIDRVKQLFGVTHPIFG